MAKLLVRAHWTRPGVAPVPAPIGATGAPPNMAASPPWPSPPVGPVGAGAIYSVWCPLVPQAVLDDPAVRWGVNTVPPRPPAWPGASGAVGTVYDQGYGGGAVDFRVTGVRLWQDPGKDFTYTISAPDGTVLGPITPSSLVSAWTIVPLPAAIASGKGIWRIDIDRAAGSSVAAPGLEIGTPAAAGGVDEPYVSPYGNPFEGILGLEFTGDEVFATTVTPTVTIGPCDANGNRTPSTLALNFAPPLPPGTSYSVSWTTGAGPPTTVSGTVPAGGPPLPLLTTNANYVAGTTYFPSATIIITPPGGSPTAYVVTFTSAGAVAGTVVVPPCPITCHDVMVTHAGGNPCMRMGQPVTVTFTASFLPLMPAYTGPVNWQVRDRVTLNVLPLPLPAPTGPSLTFTFPQKGSYEVTATMMQPSPPCSGPLPSFTDPIDIVDCDCQSIIGGAGGIQVTPMSGCTFAFQVQVNNPSGATLTYTWDFGDGSGPQVLGPNPTHTYPMGTTGKKTVTVTVTSSDPNCADRRASIDVDVNCTTTPTTPTTPTTTPPLTTPPTTPTGGGGFDLCCFLIWWWGISHWVAGSLLYFGFWIAGIICSAIATVLLVIWILACCWPCLQFGRCCTLFRWVVMFNDVLVGTLFALYALVWAGNPWVLAAFGAVSTLMRILMGILNCGGIPNIFSPPTYPPCRCP
jgi:hypothetical protein